MALGTIKKRSYVPPSDPQTFIDQATATAIGSNKRPVGRPSTGGRSKQQTTLSLSAQTNQQINQARIDLVGQYPEQMDQINRSAIVAAAIRGFAQLSAAQQIELLQQIGQQ